MRSLLESQASATFLLSSPLQPRWRIKQPLVWVKWSLLTLYIHVPLVRFGVKHWLCIRIVKRHSYLLLLPQVPALGFFLGFDLGVNLRGCEWRRRVAVQTKRSGGGDMLSVNEMAYFLF